MSFRMIIPTIIARDLFSSADCTHLIGINKNFAGPITPLQQSSISIPQIMRPKDGWCSDSLSFLFSYRIYQSIYIFFQGIIPEMEFEWQMISSREQKGFYQKNLLTLKTSSEYPDAVYGGFVIPKAKLDCTLPSGQYSLDTGECLFISREDFVNKNVEFRGTNFILGAIWQKHPINYPWLFQFED